MGEHTVSSFDQELEEIDRLILDMGVLAQRMVEDATHALLNADERLAAGLAAVDIGAVRLEAEAPAERLLNLQLEGAARPGRPIPVANLCSCNG